MSTDSSRETVEEFVESTVGSDAITTGTGAGTGQRKQLATGALGGALLALGVRRRGLLGGAAALAGGVLAYRAIRGAGRGAGSTAASGHAGRTDRRASEATASVTVGRSADEVSSFLRDPENLQQVVADFAAVTSAGADRQRWTVRGPNGRGPTWETRLEVSDERLRWVPVDGPSLFGEWVVDLEAAPGDRGTQVTLRIRFDPPGGRLGSSALERLDAVPEALASVALDRLKSLLETGEVPTLRRNVSARGRGDLL